MVVGFEVVDLTVVVVVVEVVSLVVIEVIVALVVVIDVNAVEVTVEVVIAALVPPDAIETVDFRGTVVLNVKVVVKGKEVVVVAKGLKFNFVSDPNAFEAGWRFAVL